MEPAGVRGDWFVSAGMGAGSSAWHSLTGKRSEVLGKDFGAKDKHTKDGYRCTSMETLHSPFFSLIAVIYGTE